MKASRLCLLTAGAFLAACSAPAAEDGAASNEAIVGGTATTNFAAVGYLAMDFTMNGTRGVSSPFCTATLVAARGVLTAGHCLKGADQMKHQVECLGGTFHGFVFGTGNFDSNTRTYPITSYKVHDAYMADDNAFPHDMAYAILERKPDGLTPATLQYTHTGSCDYVAQGYGLTQNGRDLTPEERAEEERPTTDCNAIRAAAEKAKDAPADPPTERKSIAVCADKGESDATYGMIQTYSDQGSTCFGDSGGPLRPRGKNAVVGVVSFGTGPCGPNNRTYYTPLDQNRDLIAELMQLGK